MMEISPRDILSMKGPIEIARAVFYGKIIAHRKLLSGLAVHDLVVKCTTKKLCSCKRLFCTGLHRIPIPYSFLMFQSVEIKKRKI